MFYVYMYPSVNGNNKRDSFTGDRENMNVFPK